MKIPPLAIFNIGLFYVISDSESVLSGNLKWRQTRHAPVSVSV